MLMVPRFGRGGALPVQALQENSHAKQGRTFTDQRDRGRLRGAQRKQELNSPAIVGQRIQKL